MRDLAEELAEKVALPFDLDQLEYICDEVKGTDKWYFYPPTALYTRLTEDKESMTMNVMAKHLPNPSSIKAKSEVTRSLWNHWMGVQNGKRNN